MFPDHFRDFHEFESGDDVTVVDDVFVASSFSDDDGLHDVAVNAVLDEDSVFNADDRNVSRRHLGLLRFLRTNVS